MMSPVRGETGLGLTLVIGLLRSVIERDAQSARHPDGDACENKSQCRQDMKVAVRPAHLREYEMSIGNPSMYLLVEDSSLLLILGQQ